LANVLFEDDMLKDDFEIDVDGMEWYGVHDDLPASREASIMPVVILGRGVGSPVQQDDVTCVSQAILRDPTISDTLAQCLKEETLSLAFSQTLVLAFDDDLALYQAEHPLSRVIEALKTLKKNPKYEKALRNLVIVHGSADDLPGLIKKETGEKGGRIFVFAPDKDQTKQKIQAMDPVYNKVYIDEKGFEATPRAYYPLAEIVVISLAQHFDHLISEGDIEKELHIDGKTVDLSARCIEHMSLKDGVLIFTLLPNAAQHDKTALVKLYTAWLPFLEAA
jgi:hypothetical protein